MSNYTKPLIFLSVFFFNFNLYNFLGNSVKLNKEKLLFLKKKKLKQK